MPFQERHERPRPIRQPPPQLIIGGGAVSESESNGVLVDQSGFSDFDGIQAAIDSGAANIIVNPGTYVENVTMDDAKQMFEFRSGVIISGTLDITVASVQIKGGLTVTGLIDWTGASGTINGQNNFKTQAGVNITGTSPFVDGGGWNSNFLSNTLNVEALELTTTATDGIVTAASGQTDSGGGSNVQAIRLDGARGVGTSLLLNDGDLYSLWINATEEILALNYIADADTGGLRQQQSADRSIVSGNNNASPATDGIHSQGASDDSIISDNISSAGTDALQAEGTDDVIYGNRIDTNFTDTTTTSVVAANDVTAF